MEQQDLLNKKTGDKELPKLEAKDIQIQGLRIDEKEIKGKNTKKKILVLICKHPDRKETIELTKEKVIRDDKTKAIGLWYVEDEDENIQKGSACDDLLKIAKVKTLGELVGKTLPTIKQSEDSSFLCIKAY